MNRIDGFPRAAVDAELGAALTGVVGCLGGDGTLGLDLIASIAYLAPVSCWFQVSIGDCVGGRNCPGDGRVDGSGSLNEVAGPETDLVVGIAPVAATVPASSVSEPGALCSGSEVTIDTSVTGVTIPLLVAKADFRSRAHGYSISVTIRSPTLDTCRAGIVEKRIDVAAILEFLAYALLTTLHDISKRVKVGVDALSNDGSFADPALMIPAASVLILEPVVGAVLAFEGGTAVEGPVAWSDGMGGLASGMVLAELAEGQDWWVGLCLGSLGGVRGLVIIVVVVLIITVVAFRAGWVADDGRFRGQDLSDFECV